MRTHILSESSFCRLTFNVRINLYLYFISNCGKIIMAVSFTSCYSTKISQQLFKKKLIKTNKFFVVLLSFFDQSESKIFEFRYGGSILKPILLQFSILTSAYFWTINANENTCKWFQTHQYMFNYHAICIIQPVTPPNIHFQFKYMCAKL